MTRVERLSFSRFVFAHARPLWRQGALLIVLTCAAGLLAVAQPAVLAAILSHLLGTSQAPLPPGANLFNLNYLGNLCLQRLGLSRHDLLSSLVILGGLYILLALLASVLTYGAYVTALKIKVRTTQRLQGELLEHLFGLDLRFFHRQKTGELMSRLTQDAVNTAQGLGPLLMGLVHCGVQLIAYSLYLLSTNAWLTGAAMGIIAAHFFLTQVLRRPVRRLVRSIYDAFAAFSTALQESLTGIRIAKSFGAEQFEQAKLRRRSQAIAESQLRHGRVERLEAPLRSALDAIGIIGIFSIAVLQLRAGALTTTGLLLYVYVGRLVIAPANQMATNVLWIQQLLASFERIQELLAEQPRVTDGAHTKARFERAVEVRHASFSYDGIPAISDVSLEIRKGEAVALVGPSGAGKSTLTDLVLRLYDPDAGEILMDGVSLRAFRQTDYRRLFGVVSQECLLFHDTVRNNIRYGRAEVTDEEIEAAARMANAHDFILRLPHGYETMVGDRGVRLSGGERQRVAIARAIVHRPEILVLDEATSALDSESERQVQEALDRVAKHTTVIVIAHRLSTVLHADQIAVMDRGRIVDVGTHQELLERCELYRHMCELQLGLAPMPSGIGSS